MVRRQKLLQRTNPTAWMETFKFPFTYINTVKIANIIIFKDTIIK